MFSWDVYGKKGEGLGVSHVLTLVWLQLVI